MKKIIIAAFICLALSSCVTTLHPLVTYDKVITDNRLTGKWKNATQEFIVQPFRNSDLFKQHKNEIEEETRKKEKAGKSTGDSILFSRSYVIEYTKGNVQYDLLGSLIRLNGELFMNFAPLNSMPAGEMAKDTSLDPGSSLSGYTIAKIQILNSNELKIDFLDGGFIYDQVKSGHLKIKNERDELYDTFLITASSEDLRQFLEKYGTDKRLYSKENSVILNRKS
jgi:hypothetical protein